MNAFKCLFPTRILFCLLDYLWLGNFGKSLYLENIRSILLLEGNTITPRLLPALIVYVLFAIMQWWIVLPLAQYQISQSFMYGALIGLVVYGIYDMTNLAVLKDWTLLIAIVDWCWGIFLCSSTAGFCAYLHQYFK
jgi:uncharacterized membrane protein